MIPKLFASTATRFTSNGLGRLSDAVECTVTEERNGPYELYMRYPITGKHYADIQISRIIYAVPADGKSGQPFRIYRIEKPLNGIVSIYAEHISYQLNRIPVMPFTASSCAEALTQMVSHSAQANPFTVWTDKSVAGNFNLTEPRAFRALLGGTQGSILDVYGKGEYEFDNYLVKLHLNRGIDTGVVLRYGKNITDLTQDENIEATITGVCPFWRDQTSGETVTLPEYAVWSSTAANFPYKRTAVVDFSSDFQEEPTVEQLRQRANKYIEDNDIGIPKVSLDVEFVPLWQMEGVSTGNPTRTLMLPATVDGDTILNLDGSVSGDTVTLSGAYWDITFDDCKVLERLHLCDTLTVRYDALGVDATAKIVKTVYNVLADRYDSLEVGDARTNLAHQIAGVDDTLQNLRAQMQNERSTLQAYVDHQTELITGGLGGYVMFNYNADGQPEELLIMDSDDMATAVNVIRMNQNGIGFSRTGYNGPFTSAWTIDGNFNADFITAGTINANLIKAGVLSDIAGNTTFNLTTGDLTAKKFYVLASHIGQKIQNQYVLNTSGIFADLRLEWEAHDAIAQMFFNSTDTNAEGCIASFVDTSRTWTSMTTSHVTKHKRIQNTYAVNVNKSDVISSGVPTSGYVFAERFDAQNSDTSDACYLMSGRNIESTSYEFINLISHTSVRIGGRLGTGGSYIDIGSSSANIICGNGSSQTAGIYLSSLSRSFTVLLNSVTSTAVLAITLTLSGALSTAKIMGQNISLSGSSSRRYKHDIEELGDDLDPHKLLELKPKQFVFNEDHPLQYQDMKGKTLPGFIAEEVEEIYPAAVIHDNETGEIENWDERRIIPGMLALIQEQQKRIEKLEKIIERMMDNGK